MDTDFRIRAGFALAEVCAVRVLSSYPIIWSSHRATAIHRIVADLMSFSSTTWLAGRPIARLSVTCPGRPLPVGIHERVLCFPNFLWRSSSVSLARLRHIRARSRNYAFGAVSGAYRDWSSERITMRVAQQVTVLAWFDAVISLNLSLLRHRAWLRRKITQSSGRCWQCLLYFGITRKRVSTYSSATAGINAWNLSWLWFGLTVVSRLLGSEALSEMLIGAPSGSLNQCRPKPQWAPPRTIATGPQFSGDFCRHHPS